MMARVSEIAGHWLGLCRKAPALRSASTALVAGPEPAHPVQPDGSGPAGRPGRVRDGIRVATGSLKVLIRNRHHLWFVFLAGLVMLFLVGAEGWMVTHLDLAMPFLIGIPAGSTIWVLDIRLFLIEMICLSCFILLLTGLVLHRRGTRETGRESIRGSFTRINGHANPLLGLSILLAAIATVMYVILSQSPFFGKIVSGITMTVFYLPYAYYLPDELSTALYFAFELMVINVVLLLVALQVIPGIVLEKKRLPAALIGAGMRVMRTWREILGCILVYGMIVLVVAAIALLIGQSPLLLNHDYDFFLQLSRGQVLMTAVCYGFIVACWVLPAAGLTAAGIAIADLDSRAAAGQPPA